jgi:hypothetical protein
MAEVKARDALIKRIEKTGVDGDAGCGADWLADEILAAETARRESAEAALEKMREALERIAREDCTLAWTGGTEPVPSHNEFGPFSEIACAALAPAGEGK